MVNWKKLRRKNKAELRTLRKNLKAHGFNSDERKEYLKGWQKSCRPTLIDRCTYFLGTQEFPDMVGYIGFSFFTSISIGKYLENVAHKLRVISGRNSWLEEGAKSASEGECTGLETKQVLDSRMTSGFKRYRNKELEFT